MKTFLSPGRSGTGGSLALVVAAALLLTAYPDTALARSSFWISSRDNKACIVSAVVQYDARFEERIRAENRISNNILQMDVHTQDPQGLCSMLMMRQDGQLWRPLLCVTKIRGNIYGGYLILPDEFTIQSPIEIRLGERTVEASFVK